MSMLKNDKLINQRLPILVEVKKGVQIGALKRLQLDLEMNLIRIVII